MGLVYDMTCVAYSYNDDGAITDKLSRRVQLVECSRYTQMERGGMIT